MLRPPLPARRPPLSAGIVTALALIAAETLLLFPLAQVADPIALGVVYLLGVLVVAIVWGAALGVGTSVVSALAFNFFHIEPTGRFTIDEAENWVALAVFLVAAVIAASVAEAARVRAAEAEQRGREADLAAELARVLLGAPDLPGALAPAAQRIAQAFGLASCRIVLGEVSGDERTAAVPLLRGEERLGTLLVPAAARAGGRRDAAGARGAARRRARARAARPRGRRDARAAPLGRDQDRGPARGVARPPLAADRDHDRRGGARVARRCRRRSGPSSRPASRARAPGWRGSSTS